MLNTMTAANTNRRHLSLFDAANEAMADFGLKAKVEVTLPDGTSALAWAIDIWRGEPGQTIRVVRGSDYELFFSSQLQVA